MMASQDATGVVITETLAANERNVRRDQQHFAGWTETAPGSGVYEFNIGSLASGATGSVTFAVSC